MTIAMGLFMIVTSLANPYFY